jgi:hypothetical protein
MAKHTLVSYSCYITNYETTCPRSLKRHHYYLVRRLALSRATEMKRLTLRGFSDKSFKAHPKVKVSSCDSFLL